MQTTLQIRVEIEVALRFKAVVERLGVPQGKALEAALTRLENDLGMGPAGPEVKP